MSEVNLSTARAIVQHEQDHTVAQTVRDMIDELERWRLLGTDLVRGAMLSVLSRTTTDLENTVKEQDKMLREMRSWLHIHDDCRSDALVKIDDFLRKQ